MADFYLKRGDTAPSISAILTEFDGTNDVPVNLTDATVVFNMATMQGTPVITRAAANVTIAINGEVSYDWQTNDTQVAGTYKAEFEATLASGKIITFPNTQNIVIEIQESLG